jgi:endonuclease/exonuclease/phosphatase (EEP) superfamily protein YafD
MQVIKKILYYSLVAISTGLILVTLLSLIYDLRFWYVKILDFPRLQYLILGIFLLPLFIISTKKWKYPSILLLLGLITVVVIQGSVIYPYLLGNKSVPDYQERGSADNRFDVLLANVLIENRQSQDFLNIIKNKDPDILLIMEVNEWWINELQSLKEMYPYHIEHPLDNAYGMALYSKIPMDNQEVKFLKHDDVPSVIVRMLLPSGKSFNFYGVHPVPPFPSDKYPDNVGEKEVALLKIGRMVAESTIPCLVAGDLNDVSWSHTARMFGQDGNLKNVRIGRGLYNTFDATSFIMSWPLDHYFVTEEFELMQLERLSKFGSDHYPLYAEFVLP